MKWILWLAEAGATFTECICCYYFLAYSTGKGKADAWKGKILLSITLSALILCVNRMILSSWFPVLLAIIFVSVSWRIRSSVPVLRSLPFILLFYSCMNAIDFLCAVIMGVIAGNYELVINMITNLSAVRICFIAVSKTLLVICTFILKKALEQIAYISKYFFTIAFLGSIGSIYLIKMTFTSLAPETILNWLLFLILMIVMIFSLSLYEKYKTEQYTKRLIQINNNMIQEQYVNLIENNGKVRKLQHDFKNHMSVLSELLCKGEYEEAEKYLGGLRAFVDCREAGVWTGNIIVDSILNHKKAEACKRGVPLDINTDILRLRGIAGEDICVILANLLDNALEAAQKNEEGERWIRVTIRKMKGFLLIKIENSLAVPPVSAAGSLRTLKKDKKLHGIGLKSVQEAVEKYQGEFHYSYDENHFLASITFFDT